MASEEVNLCWNCSQIKVNVDVGTLPREREHLERALAERLNICLIWVGLITTAAFAGTSPSLMKGLILLFGALVCFPMAVVLQRTEQKLRWTLAILRAANPQDAAAVNKTVPGSLLASEYVPRFLRVNSWMGCVMPWLCFCGLLAAGIIGVCGLL